MSPRTLLIVNPASRGGRSGRRFPALEPRVRALLGDVEIAWTERRGHATALARKAAPHVDRIVSVGGDGTAHEVAEGLLESGEAGRVALGFLPFGTGGDFVRTLGVPADVGAALERIRSGVHRRVDAARIRTRDFEGAVREGWLVNEISVGFAGFVARTVDAGGKWLGGSAAFAQATVRTILRHPVRAGRVTIDGDVVHEGPFVLASLCNGRYFGGGMRIAPDAEPDDGLLDCIVIPGLSRIELLGRLGRLYRGTHLRVAGVLHRRGRVVEIEPDGEPAPYEVDGEALGTIPLRAEVVPAALTIVGAEAS